MYKIRKKQWILANSDCHFADLKAKIFVSGCHGNRACWGKNRVEYFDNVTTLTCSESFMKIWDHECPAPFKIFWFLSGIALNYKQQSSCRQSHHIKAPPITGSAFQSRYHQSRVAPSNVGTTNHRRNPPIKQPITGRTFKPRHHLA